MQVDLIVLLTWLADKLVIPVAVWLISVEVRLQIGKRVMSRLTILLNEIDDILGE